MNKNLLRFTKPSTITIKPSILLTSVICNRWHEQYLPIALNSALGDTATRSSLLAATMASGNIAALKQLCFELYGNDAQLPQDKLNALSFDVEANQRYKNKIIAELDNLFHWQPTERNSCHRG